MGVVLARRTGHLMGLGMGFPRRHRRRTACDMTGRVATDGDRRDLSGEHRGARGMRRKAGLVLHWAWMYIAYDMGCI